MNKAAGQQQAGTLLDGRYRIVRPLGQGGMGTVYLARHEQLETNVAVKEVRGARTDDTEFKAALEQSAREARFLVKLNHPNLPKVMDAFVEDDRFFLIMEYIEGVTLEAKLWEGGGAPLDAKLVVNWSLQIADVLAYLHTQDPPIIFRDLKPANIMLQPNGDVRLIDFGIARRFQPGASKDTMLLGSVGYSPPEQFGHHQTDARSDLYALGATLHHLLTGRDPSLQPFKFAPATSLNPAVPEMLSRLVERCVSIEADARPRDIQEIERDLIYIRDELSRAPVRALSGAARSVSTGGAGDVPEGPARASGSGSGRAGSGPYVSRRPSSGSTSHSVVASPASRANPAALIAALIAVALLVGVPTVIYLSNRRADVRGHARSADAGIGAPPSQPTIVPDVPPPVTPGSGAGTEVDAPAVPDTAASVRVDNPTMAGDADTGYVLRFRAAGAVKGKASYPALVAVYLYYGDGTPMDARNPDNRIYATKEGQLSVARSVQIDADEQYDCSGLDVPSSEFPADAYNRQIKYQVRVIVDRRVVGRSEKADAPSDLAWNRFFNVGDTGSSGGYPSPGTAGVGASAGRR